MQERQATPHYFKVRAEMAVVYTSAARATRKWLPLENNKTSLFITL